MMMTTGKRREKKTKEEYEELVPKIIEKMKVDGEWGQFFPPSISHFGYNETVANDYYPLSKTAALERGWTWYDETLEPVEEVTDVPSTIDDVPNV